MTQLLSDTSTQVKSFYDNTKKYHPLIAFFSGFTWDSLTLTRIDLLMDNMLLFIYILLAGLSIYLVTLAEENLIEHPLVLKYKDLYPNLTPFFFGSLFSAYVVYYFQSASLTKNWLFLLFLIILLLSNEFLKDRFAHFQFQISLYYLAAFSFFIFYLPVLFETMNSFLFILSGFISSLFISGLIYLLYLKMRENLKPHLKRLGIILASIYILFNLLYFFNIIPPVPLSLKEAGIFHDVQRIDNSYNLKFEQGAWYEPFKVSDDLFHHRDGDLVYCYTSIFAPTNLNTKIFHHWQMYDENKDKWITSDRTSYKITGGREGGFRGYTNKRNVQSGQWRVDVETELEQLLGRVSFTIESVQDSVRLEEIIK
jgi:hypothetical protein